MNTEVALHARNPREDVARVGRYGEDVTRMLRGICFREIQAYPD